MEAWGETGPAFGRGHRCQDFSRVQNSPGQPCTLAGSSKALEEAKGLCWVGDAFAPGSTARALEAWPWAPSRVFSSYESTWTRGFPGFRF